MKLLRPAADIDRIALDLLTGRTTPPVGSGHSNPKIAQPIVSRSTLDFARTSIHAPLLNVPLTPQRNATSEQRPPPRQHALREQQRRLRRRHAIPSLRDARRPRATLRCRFVTHSIVAGAPLPVAQVDAPGDALQQDGFARVQAAVIIRLEFPVAGRTPTEKPTVAVRPLL